MATLKNITHDSGSPLTDHWTNVTNGSGRMSVTVAAALNSSVEGLNVAFGTSSTARVNEPFSSPASEQLNLLFYFDPNGAGTPTVDSRTLIRVGLSDDGSQTGFLIVAIAIDKNTDGTITVFFSISLDGGGGGSAGQVDITDAPHSFRMTSKRASTDISSDGEFEFFVDEVSQSSAVNVDNFDLFPTIDFIYVQFEILEAAMSGTTLYADEFLLSDDATVAFSGYDLVLGGGQL